MSHMQGAPGRMHCSEIRGRSESTVQNLEEEAEERMASNLLRIKEQF